MTHKGCELCKYDNEPMDSEHCLGCTQNATDKYVRMSNADRIRSMTDEELAEFFHGMWHGIDGNGHLIVTITDIDTGKEKKQSDDLLSWISWLQQEVEDEHE